MVCINPITVGRDDDWLICAPSMTDMYVGHMDKQPPTEGWRDGLGPYTPVIGGDHKEKLYGRGGADDGYAVFGAISAVRVLKEQNIAHGRIVIMIEACEESGSQDLMYYVNQLEKEIGIPTLVLCLDSGCGNYDQMWLTTSLRGMMLGHLKVQVLKEGVHSGAAGVVPDSFRIMRQLLDRIEDSKTGRVLLKASECEIPEVYVEYARETAATMGAKVHTNTVHV